MDVMGVQQPRLEWIPPDTVLSDAGKRAIDLCGEIAGLYLDEWQQYVLDNSLRRRPNGRRIFEVALVVSRQNGKGAILEARELAGLFLDERDGFGDERLILHSAHEFKTASEAFRRIMMLIEDSPILRKQVKHIYLQRGQESIELWNGKRLRFIARSSGSGRGFSGDLIILDEAQILGNQAMDALLPTLSARPNPQVLYTATAGDQEEHDCSQLARLRKRGIEGNQDRLAFFEWSAEEDDDPDSPYTWARANPGLGKRITVEHVRGERDTLSSKGFARERLSIGDYPAEDAGDWAVIGQDVWTACKAPGT